MSELKISELSHHRSTDSPKTQLRQQDHEPPIPTELNVEAQNFGTKPSTHQTLHIPLNYSRLQHHTHCQP